METNLHVNHQSVVITPPVANTPPRDSDVSHVAAKSLSGPVQPPIVEPQPTTDYSYIKKDKDGIELPYHQQDFYYNINTKQAHLMIENYPLGTFLFHNPNKKNKIALTCVQVWRGEERTKIEIGSTLIETLDNGGVKLNGITHKNLQQLLENSKIILSDPLLTTAVTHTLKKTKLESSFRMINSHSTTI